MAEIVDKARALEALGGDDELLIELAEVYLADEEGLVSSLESAAKSRDPERVAHAAHRAKGAVANFYADAAVAAALELEQAGRSGDLSDVDAQWKELELQLSLVKQVLIGVRDGV